VARKIAANQLRLGFAGCPILLALREFCEVSAPLRRVGIFAMKDMPPIISFVRAILS